MNRLPITYRPFDLKILWTWYKNVNKERKERSLPSIKECHLIGYSVANVTFETAKQDTKLFYRSDPEIYRLYVEPVEKYDWSKYNPDNKTWRNLKLKVNKEIERALEGS